MILLQKSDMDRNSNLTIYCAHKAIDAITKWRFEVLSYPRAPSRTRLGQNSRSIWIIDGKRDAALHRNNHDQAGLDRQEQPVNLGPLKHQFFSTLPELI